MSTYQETYRLSLQSPDNFWLQAARQVHWHRPPTTALNTSQSPFNRWFEDGQINASYNAVDVHVKNGRAQQAAIIYDSPLSNTKRTISYQQLYDQVTRFAGVLAAQGVTQGDRVLIYMPMVPEALIAVLASARLGAVHCVVFGGFAANELAVRIDDCQPRVIVSASCGIEPSRIIAYKPLLDDALLLASHSISSCIMLQRDACKAHLDQSLYLDWDDLMISAKPVDCVPVASTDPLYILYTSGTTGQPKGVVRDTGGSVVSLKWSMSAIYNVQPGDVYWAASDIGWVVGHSYIIYGPLLQGCTSILYEGKPVGTPDAGAFWRVIEEHKVTVLFTAPTAFRAIKKEDPNGKLLQQYDLGSLQSLFLAGERCDPDTLQWAQNKLAIPVIDHWWQTETGWSICANCQGIEAMPVVPGSHVVGSPWL